MASIQPAGPMIEPTPVSVSPTPPTSDPPAENRFMIRDIDWATYRKIADALMERHYHLSFDGRDLELMTTYLSHDIYGRLICRLVAVLTEELDYPIASSGQFTMEREDLEQAIEADESFYIMNEAKVRGKRHVDLTVDPPPDLGIEIDMTTDSRRRLGIYAKIKVPEIWRFDGKQVTILQLMPDGQYTLVANSHLFPFLTDADLTRFIRERNQTEENALIRSFRTWVREQIAKQ